MDSEWVVPPRMFVTGTDTDVGKTLVAATLLLAAPQLRFWKPVQSGATIDTDTGWLRRITGLSGQRLYPEHTVLQAPLSPNIAAAREGVAVQMHALSLPPGAHTAPLLIEGAGGVFVPLNEQETMLDLMLQMQAPVLVVARSTLGTINHTLLTLRVLRQAGLYVWGVVFNGPPDPEAMESVRHFGDIPRTVSLPWLETIAPGTLAEHGKRLLTTLGGRQ